MLESSICLHSSGYIRVCANVTHISICVYTLFLSVYMNVSVCVCVCVCRFHHLKMSHIGPFFKNLFTPSQPLATADLYSIPKLLHFSRMSHKLNHDICILCTCLISPKNMHLRLIHIVT